MEEAADMIVLKTESLLAAFEGSHPLVPKRKQSAYELERGPIYPEAEADKWTDILQDKKSSRSPNLYSKQSQKSMPQHMPGNAADVAIRTDPSLEVFFTATLSDTSKDGREQTFRKKTLGMLNPT